MTTLFKKISTPDAVPATEESIAQYWVEHRVFERSVEERDGDKKFVFYEGPPTANGKPACPSRVLAHAARTSSAASGTMQGHHVRAQGAAGTRRGCPSRSRYEKAARHQHAKDRDRGGSAWPSSTGKLPRVVCSRTKEDWERVHVGGSRTGSTMEHPYVTYKGRVHRVGAGAILSRVPRRRGCSMKDFKVLPYCPRCSTGLSNHEVSPGLPQVVQGSFGPRALRHRRRGARREAR